MLMARGQKENKHVIVAAMSQALDFLGSGK